MADDNSEPDGMKVLRLYGDAAGESRFETATIPLALKEFAPPRFHSALATPNLLIGRARSMDIYPPSKSGHLTSPLCGKLTFW